MQARPELLARRWIVYSGSVTHSGFFSAVGCEVVTGLRYVPDLEMLSAFDPTGEQHDVTNRSGLLLAEPLYSDEAASFDQLEFYSVRWNVSPLDPRLRQVGIRYAAFATRPPAAVAARMTTLSDFPVDNFWLYALP